MITNNRRIAVVIFIVALLILWSLGQSASAHLAERLTPCQLTSADIVSECISTQRLDSIAYSELVEIENPRVLVFGETHFADAHRKELILALPSLKKLGFRQLALEAMPSSKQYLIADYELGRITRSELIAVIKNIWGHRPESYVELIDAALALEIDVIFLDSDKEPSGNPIDVTAPNWEELEQQAREMRLQARSRREAHWMDVLFGLVPSENNRVIVLVGSNHTAASAATTPVGVRLSELSISSTTIALEGGDVFFDSVLTEAARRIKMERARFLVKIAPGDANSEGDYHLHLPQTDTARILGKRG